MHSRSSSRRDDANALAARGASRALALALVFRAHKSAAAMIPRQLSPHLRRRCGCPPSAPSRHAPFSAIAIGAADARRARAAQLAEKRAQLQQVYAEAEAEAEAAPAAPRDGPLRGGGRAEAEARATLLAEAGALTRSMYRTCLRSVAIIRPGNAKDEADFRAREEAQLRMFDDDAPPMSSADAFAPPVDRKNELASRADYYAEWTRENFGQESDCLSPDPWREADVDRYLHFLRAGEERRRWLLGDYGFDDPYGGRFDLGRVGRFEEEVREFVRGSYGDRGWLLQDELAEEGEGGGGDGEACIFDGDDDFASALGDKK